MSNNNCSGFTNLIFSCSGAADVGHLADLAARKLTKNGVGKMFCLAGIGGNIPGILKTTQAADNILVIDGCPIDCAKNSLEEKGFQEFNFIRVTDLGFEKGKTEINDDAVNMLAEKATEKLTTK